MASGIDGFKGITSSTEEELLSKVSGPKRKFYEFEFLNDQECTVKINDSNPIPCPAEVGITFDENDVRIESFVIVESGISYIWRGKY